MHAASNDDGPTAVRATGVDRARLVDGSFKVIDDLTLHVPDVIYDPPDHRQRVCAAGYRAVLAISLSARDQQFGLQFWSKRVNFFRREQVPIARRIAEHVALAVSHQQLAEAVARGRGAGARRAARGARAIAVGGTRYAQRLRARDRSLRGVEGRAARGDAGRGDRNDGAAHRRIGHRQGSDRALHPPRLGAPRRAVRRHQLRGAAGAAARVGAVRPRARRLHRRAAAKPGQIELAVGGVLFLDEVGEMSPSAQAKLLRVLQEREFLRLGGTRMIRANVRVIAATNRDLHARDGARRVPRGPLLPPAGLRDSAAAAARAARRHPAVERAFLRDIGQSFGRPPAGMTREASQALLAYRWPGNVRELRNVLERAAIVCEGGLIAPEHLSFQQDERPLPAATTNVKTMERQMVEQVLRECGGNKSKAARKLGLTRKQLYVRLRQYEAVETV